MSWLEAIVLGVVQGLTEFLPISSSAHLSIVGRFFGHDPGAAFTAITQLGTEAAVLIYFWRDIVTIVRKWSLSLVGKVAKDDPDVRMGWLVIIGSIPIGVLGLLLQDYIEAPFRNLWLTATMLLLFALVIAWADMTARNERPLEQLTWGDGLKFGLWQALALIPGVSRSGGTISGGLFMGYRREAAARYSFLLAIPAVLASGTMQVVKVLGEADPADPTPWPQILVATLIAFGIGFACIAWLLKYIATHDFKPFVIYRILLALALYVLLGTGVIDPVLPSST